MPDQPKKSASSGGDDEPSRRVPPTIPALSNVGLDDAYVAAVREGLLHALSKAADISGLSLQPKDNSFLVALSGGPDSTALLAAMAVLSGPLGFSLYACHVNHLLRGEESDEDEQFCRKLCSAWTIPLDVKLMERDRTDKSDLPTSESALRDARYALLEESCNNRTIDFIVLGHTLDDQAETMLFRLFRGTGRKGLLGMEPARTSGSRFLLRPLLQSRRQEGVDFLQSLGLSGMHDSSNDSTDYTRNYIRQNIVPAIAERFPGFQSRLNQLRSVLSEEETFLEQLVDREFADLDEDGWLISRLSNKPETLLKRLIVRQLRERAIEVSHERVDMIYQILKTGTGAVSLDERWDVRADGKRMIWLDRQEEQMARTPLLQELRIPGVNIIAAWGMALRIEEWHPTGQDSLSFPPARAWEALVDLSDVSRPLVARTREPGDVIQPFGMYQSMKVKRYMQTHKPVAEQGSRRQAIVVADSEEVVWIPGVGISEKLRVKAQPSHRLVWVKLLEDDVNLC